MRSIPREIALRGSLKEKQSVSYYTKAESQNNSKTVASGKQRAPTKPIHSNMDLHHTLNAKRGQKDGDLLAKLVAKVAATTKTILPARSEARTTKSTPKDHLLPRYETLFTPEIERMKPLENVNHPKFTMYERKSDSMSYIN